MIWIVAERVVLVQRPLTGAGRFNAVTCSEMITIWGSAAPLDRGGSFQSKERDLEDGHARVQRPVTGAGRFNWQELFDAEYEGQQAQRP